MATTIQIKRSSTASGVPLATDLAVGELAVNLADKRLFTKQSDGTIIELSTNPTDLDAATLRIDGVEITASATELNSLDGFTGSTAELNLLDGLTATTIELNTLDGITASTAELNKLDGYTGSTAELNILDGVTATTAELNKLDGFTGTVADLNYAKDLRATGVTTTEFDKLDGLTATTTELNYVDGVTSNIQTQLDSMVEKAGDTMTGDLDFGDNVKAKFGASDDLQIFHTGSYSAIRDVGTGALFIGGENYVDIGNAGASATYARFHKDDRVDLYHNNSIKLSTKATGVTVTGEVVSDGLSLGDNDKATFGASDDLQIYHDTLNSVIADTGTGNLVLAADDFRLTNSTQTANMIKADEGGAVTLTHNGGNKISTTSTGVDVTGTVTADGLTVEGVNLNAATHAIEISRRTDSSNNNILIKDLDGSTVVGQVNHKTEYYSTDGDQISAKTRTEYSDVSGGMDYIISTSGAGVAVRDRLKINSLGSVFFFEDTGTTAKFVWDSSAESLNVGGNTNYGYAINAGDSGFGINSTSTAQLVMRGTEYRFQGVNASPMTFYTANSERMRINSSGNVGIGTASPSGELHVKSASANANLYLQRSIYTPWRFSAGSSYLAFNQDSSEKARIDSSGNLLVGTTTTYPGLANTTAGVSISQDAVWASRSGNIAGSFNRLSSDGDIVHFRKDGSTVGSIGTSSNRLTIGTGDTGLIFSSLDYIRPWDVGSNSSKDASVTLGGPSDRFKDLYLSGGVYLGGTGAANKLDDYEEGTFTPTALGAATGGTGTYTYQDGRYTKIGNKVFIEIVLSWSAHTGTGGMRIGGLPFVTNGFRQTFEMTVEHMTYTGTPKLLNYGNNSNELQLLRQSSASGLTLIDMDSAVNYMVITGSYTTNS